MLGMEFFLQLLYRAWSLCDSNPLVLCLLISDRDKLISVSISYCCKTNKLQIQELKTSFVIIQPPMVINKGCVDLWGAWLSASTAVHSGQDVWVALPLTAGVWVNWGDCGWFWFLLRVCGLVGRALWHRLAVVNTALVKPTHWSNNQENIHTCQEFCPIQFYNLPWTWSDTLKIHVIDSCPKKVCPGPSSQRLRRWPHLAIVSLQMW